MRKLGLKYIHRRLINVARRLKRIGTKEERLSNLQHFQSIEDELTMMSQVCNFLLDTSINFDMQDVLKAVEDIEKTFIPGNIQEKDIVQNLIALTCKYRNVNAMLSTTVSLLIRKQAKEQLIAFFGQEEADRIMTEKLLLDIYTMVESENA